VKNILNLPRIAALLAVSLLLPLMAQSAVPPAHPKLDRRLGAIAAAVDRHEEAGLMSAALARQVLHANSPLEARWNAEGRVQVYLYYDPSSGAPRDQDLLDLGIREMKDSPELGVVQAWVPAASLDAVGDLPGVTRVSVPRYAVVKRAPTTAPVTYTGSVTTQGDQILKAAQFRTATGYRGQGVRVGVISDGDDHIGSSQSTGDLPSGIWNDPRDAGGSGGFSPASTGDEGTAMMEIIYDLAPGVKQLGFCGPQTSVDFISCLNDFASDIHANIIVDDLGFPGGAMFTTDTFTKAIQDFAKAHPSIRLVTAGGNDGTGYWQGTFSSPTPVTVSQTVNGVSYTQALNFGTSGSPNAHLSFNVPAGDTIDYIVEWDDPWDDTASTNDPNDYDVVLFNGSNKPIACNQGMNINPNNGSCTFPSPKQPLDTPGPTPVQGARWQNSTGSTANVHLEVFYVTGTPGDRIKILVFDEGAKQIIISPSTAGSIYGHAALAYPTETTAGAIFADDALLGIYTIESYSSQGPVETGVTGGTSASIMKPDFAAPDCVSVTGAGGFENPFCGTSAAAPHIAGAMALLMSAYPKLSAYTLMKQTAIQPGSPNPNGVFGNGVPDLQAVLAANIPNPLATITSPGSTVAVKLGSQVNFKGSCNFEGDGGATSFNWSFGSGSGIADSSLANPSVVFNKEGNFITTLSCTDSIGTGTDQVSITASTPPTASITAPSSGASVTTGASVGFKASCDFQAVTSGTAVDWDFDRTKTGIGDSSQLNPMVRFNKAGNYTVTLTCSDALGTGTDTVKITVTAASSGGGGGGAPGPLTLVLLCTLAAFHRRRRNA